MTLFHGGPEPVKIPEIRKAKYTKDFGTGFYCTEFKQQAEIWSTKRSATGYITSYAYTILPELTVKQFVEVISRAAFWELIKFTKPTHQISFHNEKALQALQYVTEEVVARAQ